MKIASAQLVPYSSVVGQSVLLMDETGRAVGQLAIIGAGNKEATVAIGQQIVDMIANVPRYEAVLENLSRLSTSRLRGRTAVSNILRSKSSLPCSAPMRGLLASPYRKAHSE